MRASVGVLASNRNADAFDPTNVPGLQLWLDANDASTFSFASGSLVSQWSDKSGNARHFVIVTSSPTRTAGLVNGKAAVDFSSVNQYLRTAVSVTLLQPITIFTVAVNDLLATVNRGRVLTNRVDSNFAVIHSDGGSLSDTVVLMAGTANVNGPDNAISNTTQHQGTCITDGSASRIRVDGVSSGPVSPGGSSLFLGTLGAAFDGTKSLDGKICEVLIYSGALSSTYYLAVEAYLKAKWGTP